MSTTRTKSTTGRSGVTGLAHVETTTEDLERAVEFYATTIGLRLVAVDHGPHGAGPRTGVLATASGAVVLLLHESDQPRRRGDATTIAVRADSAAAFEDICGRLVDAGATDGQTCAAPRGPVHVLAFVDPDGHPLELIRDNPAWIPQAGIELVEPA